MTEFLSCPACGWTNFEQDRTTTCEKTHTIAFSTKGDIEVENLVDRDVIEEVSAGAYRCEDCGWELVDENGQPITHPDEIVATVKQAAQALAPSRKPDAIPDDPKAYYSATGEWRGWRDFFGVPADSPICDECGTHPCECDGKREARQDNSQPSDRPDDGWHQLGAVTIDSATLLLVDPIHQGRVDPGAEDGQIAISGGDHSAVQVATGIGDGRYRVEGRFLDLPLFGRRLAEIRVRFLDEGGNWLGGDPQHPAQGEQSGGTT